MKHPANKARAEQLRTLICLAHDYRHVDVRPHGQHLIVELLHDSEREPVARATRLDAQGYAYGLSFRTHTDTWEPMPITGTLEEIARALTQELGAYLDPANL
jgi:hypothetical protein